MAPSLTITTSLHFPYLKIEREPVDLMSLSFAQFESSIKSNALFTTDLRAADPAANYTLTGKAAEPATATTPATAPTITSSRPRSYKEIQRETDELMAMSLSQFEDTITGGRKSSAEYKARLEVARASHAPPSTQKSDLSVTEPTRVYNVNVNERIAEILRKAKLEVPSLPPTPPPTPASSFAGSPPPGLATRRVRIWLPSGEIVSPGEPFTPIYTEDN